MADSETPSSSETTHMTEAALYGLTHQCSDPECHVAGFVVTLQQMGHHLPVARQCPACGAEPGCPCRTMLEGIAMHAFHAARHVSTPPASTPEEGDHV